MPAWFQYPQADRRGCNRLPHRLGAAGESVSVSTSGSKGVQRFIPDYGRLENLCFSIHKRIEGGATGYHLYSGDATNLFQYPQADRRGCNFPKSALVTIKLFVSVSTSGSKGVQLIVVIFCSNSLPCFSIHKRIEGGATEQVPVKPLTGVSFQYPQADRRGCNVYRICPPCAALRVSVSTSGSKGVQPQNHVVFRLSFHGVSVSTSGSKGVQLRH